MIRLLCLSAALLILGHPGQGAELPGCAHYEQYRCPGGKGYPVHLTFDDGPDVGLTPQVLDTLARSKVQSTFFIMGEKLDSKSPRYSTQHPPLIRRMLEEGHRVGSHSYRHVMHTEFTDEQVRDLVRRAKSAGREELGVYLSPIFRLPWGDGWYNERQKPERSRRIMEILKEEGFTHVGWDVVSWDWDLPRQRKPGILEIVLKRVCAEEGGVVLMHDIQINTARHLEEWIHAMRCLGHRFERLESFLDGGRKTGVLLPPQDCGRARTFPAGGGNLESLKKDCEKAIGPGEFRPW